MSLLDNAYEDFRVLNKTVVDDGYGGVSTIYTNGASIKCAVVYDSSKQMKIAQALGSTSAYTIIVKKNIELDYHTVLKRVSDNKIFRITTNSDDFKTPDSAGLNMREYNAEEWELPPNE